MNRAATFVAALVVLAACSRPRPLVGEGGNAPKVQVPTGDPTGGPQGGTATLDVGGCTLCHGTRDLDNADADPLVASAPPRALSGQEADPAIGAHRAHLVNGSLRYAVECASCHLLPASDRIHPAQRQRKVSFSRLATTAWSGAPLAPVWNGTTCASTYCHGSFPFGAAGNAPSWSGGAAQAQCGSCHGVPPGGSHPQDPAGGPLLDCGGCHPGYTRTSVNLALHVNGRPDGGGHPSGWKEPDQHALSALQDGLATCTTCHTGFGPANGIAGSSCDGCHADPSVYGPYATGAYPAHPSWRTECTFCHGGRDNPSGAPPRNTHVISSATTPQPTTDATIGAHTSHVGTPSSSPASRHGISTGLDCTACHATRWTSATDPGHIDEATADVVFGAVGSTPNPGGYARPSCSSSYCHGNFPGGAGGGAVSWTGTFGATFTLSCTSCHGAPPGPTSATVHHPPNPNCSSCHPGYTATTVSVATHVDGTPQHTPATGCTQCHGDITADSPVASTDVTAAPGSNASAVDTHGNPATATTARGVGTHAKHLTGTTWRSAAIACVECHAVPAAGDTSHAAGNAVVSFGSLARTAWAGQPAITPVWNGAGGAPTLTCGSTYCHGAFENGTTAAPTWTAAGSVGCGSCHGVSATNGPGGSHPTFGATQNCGSCHGGSYTNAAVDRARHMNGALEVANLTCSSCHGTAGRTPVASATWLDALGANLVKSSPPADAGHGAAATGAHLAHVNQGDTAAPGPLSSALPCSTCHPVPTSTVHSNGAVNVVFGGLATTGGASPAPYDFTGHSCRSTYCHGAFTGGNGANAIAWTASGKLACTGCHGAPPGPTSVTVHHPPNPNCSSCHPGYGASTVTAATHVDGTPQHTPATGCTQCHGDLTASAVASTDVKAAPGTNASAVDAHGNAATTARGVGTHGKHLTGTTWRSAPIACGECHAVPAAGDVSHAAGNPAVTFGALARTAWAGQPAITPAWNGAGGAPTLTCASTYCHGAFKNGAGDEPTWNAAGSVGCGSCHGVSATSGPGGTHPTLGATQNCGSCHGGGYATTGSVDPSKHMNGRVDGGGESTGGTNCGGCHSTIWNAMNGTVVKATKHRLLLDVPTDDAAVWTGTTLSTVPASSRSCVNMCHGDHPHDLTSPVVATHENNVHLDATTPAARGGTTRTSATRDSSDFDAAAANGGLCVSCHQRPVAAANGITVPKAAFDASAHDYTTNTVGTATYAWAYQLHDGGLFVRDCTKCHGSRAEGTTPAVAASGSATVAVHFGDDASLLAGTSRPAGTAAGFVCYNCHGTAANPAAGAQGNRSGKDIQSQIAHATTSGQSGHPAISDTVHDSVAEYTNAVFGNALGVPAGAGQRHASCMDCHDSHRAKAGTHAVRTNLAGPPLEGAWGARLSAPPAFWASPTSASFAKQVIVAGTDLEATLCFKCHSSFYGTPLPTSPSGGYAGTDTAKEFNPNNAGSWYSAGTANSWSTNETAGGFHPVLANAGNNLGAVNLANLVTTSFAWSTTARNLMTCTDCHESDTATDPNGPHGSAAGFILRGPNTLWNGTMVATSTGMPTGAFCANCHSAAYASSRFNPTSGTGNHINRSAHRVACWNCHARIPHGGPRPGILVAPAGAAAGVGGTIAGWDNAAPYFGLTSASGNKLYISSYPTSRTNGWSQNNCGCNGTGH